MKTLIALSLCIFLSSVLHAEDVIVGVANNYPPYVDREIEKEGVATEIIRQAFKKEGYVLQMKWLPWNRALAGAEEVRYDLIPHAWYTDDRSKKFLYSEPYLTNRLIFVKRVEDPFQYSDLTSLKDKKLAFSEITDIQRTS